MNVNVKRGEGVIHREGTGKAVEIRLLGAVEAWSGDQQLDLGPRQQRLILAAFATANGSSCDPGSRFTTTRRVYPGRSGP
jgi:hypothetical protein